MSTRLEFYPADGGDALIFTTGPAAPLKLVSMGGLGPVTVQPLTVKTPGQSGQTLLDVIVPPRVVTAVGQLQAADLAALWPMRAAFCRALVRQPVRPGETQTLGVLRIVRDGSPSLELDVVPLSSAVPAPKSSVGILPVDVEFEAPYPNWREIADALLAFVASGGWSFGEGGTVIEFPLEMPSNNIEQEAINAGDVDAPVLIRMYGEATTVRMLNETTGETIEILTTLAAGEYVEIDTSPGKKAVTLVSGGVRSDLMAALNLSLADFWTLRPGSNMVKFEADVNTSGSAEILWRQRYSGI
jgi:hypothetical protein